jgi:NAD(P)-dependent dehydrogenase (short-subunit alcohol dehydrogenase family)
MKGKSVLITEATSGIGFHTARALASMGARVLVTGRDEARGRAALDRLRLEARHDRVAFLAVDHSTVGGNRDLAERVLQRVDRLDVLVNNVGAIHARRQETEDGYDATLAMNFLGPFVLMPLLLESAPACVVNVVSSAYSMWKRDPFEDLAAKQRYVGIEAYAHSKLLKRLV